MVTSPARSSPPGRRWSSDQARAGSTPSADSEATVCHGLGPSTWVSATAAAAAAGALGVSYIPVRLPWEVAPLFRAWLDEHFPDRAGKVMATIQSLRGGRDNDPGFFTRMRGQGVWAELLRTRFRIARAKHGFSDEHRRLNLDCSRFRPPAGAQGELF